MTPERWQRITKLFHSALKHDAGSRAAFLDGACDEDRELRVEVDAMLKAHHEAGGFGDAPAFTSVSHFEGVELSNSRESQIFNYFFVRKLGEGGMGEVYEVEQTQPIHRKAALKLLKWGMDTKEVVARFESERQALALMSHPNIAGIFDGGSTPEGRPYFVMEYVEGSRITEYCDAHRLSIVERLELYRQVCEGVQHAHQKGIIHRDLKPSNVLIAIQDGNPIPKIIDFGLAKAMDQKLTDQTMFTQAGSILGTPAYMSPEQVLGKDLDTRTDVYSLGVLLYELLIGLLPFDVQELSLEGWGGLQRKIVEEEPIRPSAQVTVQEAEKRRSDESSLVKDLVGDLDWITQKALEKDRSRRYGSPSELAADIGRHLNHEPVLASPPSRTYRLRKFVRRHRVGVASAAIAGAALLAGTVGTTIGFIRATRAERAANQEAENARRVADFLRGLFKVSDPSEARGNSITAREILDRGAEKIDKELNGQPLVKTQMMSTIGSVYTALGLYPQAQSLLEKAVSIGGDTARRVKAEPLMQLAWLEFQQGKYAASLAHYQEALPIFEDVLGPGHSDVGRALAGIGIIYRNTGKLSQAQIFLEKSLTVSQKALGPDHTQVAEVLNHLGWLYNLTGKYNDAIAATERALSIKEKALGPDDPNLAWTMNDLGVISSNMGDYARARQYYERALSIRQKVLGPEHPNTAESLDNLGTLHWYIGKYTEANSYYERALAIREKTLGPQHTSVAASLNNVALSLRSLGDEERAERLYERAIGIKEKALGPDHPDVALALSNLAFLLYKRNDLNRARQLHERASAITEKSLGPEHPDNAASLLGLGQVYLSERNFEKARKLAERALAIQEKALGPEHPEIVKSLELIANVFKLSDKYGEAKPFLERELAIEEKALGSDDPTVAAVLMDLADSQEKTGNYDQAKTLVERALTIREKKLGPDDPVVRNTVETLGEVHRRLRDYQRALLLFHRALGIAEKGGPQAQENASWVLTRLALVYAAQGDRNQAASFNDRATTIQKQIRKENDAAFLYSQASYSALLGDRRKAMDFLKRAVDSGFSSATMLRDPDLVSFQVAYRAESDRRK
jgi:non-specific serine/threonine protein kinase/serine/threonine-protein kinase